MLFRLWYELSPRWDLKEAFVSIFYISNTATHPLGYYVARKDVYSMSKPNKLFRFGAAVVLFLALMLGVAGQAQAVTKWTPVERAIITAPKSTKGFSSETFVNNVCAAVKAAPPGAQIHVATYWSSDEDVLRCFIVANRDNNVHLTYTTWHTDYNRNKKKNKKILMRLRSLLGTNTKNRSYFKVVYGSPYLSGKDKGSQHFKGVTISEVVAENGARIKNVTLLSSGNFSAAAASKSWNFSHAFVNRAKIYNGVAGYIQGMRDKTKKSFKPVVDNDVTLRFYPGGPDSVYSTLKQVKSGKIGKARAVIRVVMYFWKIAHKRIAVELCRIKRKGGDVQAIIKAKSTTTSIKRLLKKCRIRVYNAEKNGRYSHAKMTTMDVKIGSKRVQRTFGGSVNYTASAFSKNSEVSVELRGSKYYNDGVQFFNHVKKYSGKPMK